MAFLPEAPLGTVPLEQLAALGYDCASDEIIGPDGEQPERDTQDEAVPKAQLPAAVARLNPALPPEAQADAWELDQQSDDTLELVQEPIREIGAALVTVELAWLLLKPDTLLAKNRTTHLLPTRCPLSD